MRVRFTCLATVLAFVGIPVLVATEAQSAPPDWCARANKTTHFVICRNPALWMLDHCEEDLYAQVRRMAKRSVLRAVAQNEADWVRRRNRCRGDVDCIVEEYADRIDELQEITGTQC